jgi:beta-glucosidase
MPWLAQVKSVLEVWYAGDQMGTAIANLLWGDVNPSGRLPQTFPRSEADLPTAGSPAQYPGVFADGTTERPPGSTEIRQVQYSEGLQVGYRWYDAQGIEPLFPFGHGLSYTTFSYSHLQVAYGHRGLRVKFRLANTGRRTGTEVAQVYVSLPASAGEPPKRLVGWARVTLGAGRSRHVEVTLDASEIRDQHLLSYWDTGAGRWTTPRGAYTVRVGPSAGHLPLRDTFSPAPQQPAT